MCHPLFTEVITFYIIFSSIFLLLNDFFYINEYMFNLSSPQVHVSIFIVINA